MARETLKLTAKQVIKLKPGLHLDGDGLYLSVQPSGARRWFLRIRVSGKRRDIGIGPAPKTSLKAARNKATA
ncbi:MAG: DUF4102 domain-containing protein, partial [Proteobacteria bacterium]|nr:DUF4102 domain-containing protein [Pseudomonadota bacterium]